MTRRRISLTLATAASLAASSLLAQPAPGERDIPADTPRPYQREAQTPPPAAPADTPADPGAPIPRRPSDTPPSLRLERRTDSSPPAAPPSQFTPDPGAASTPAPAPAARDARTAAGGAQSHEPARHFWT